MDLNYFEFLCLFLVHCDVGRQEFWFWTRPAHEQSY